MMRALPAFAARCLMYGLAFFPVFYLAYKFHTPEFGASDYYRYYQMYLHPLDLGAADAPFVLRQLQAVIVNALYEAGLDYDTEIAFSAEGYARGVFFSALVVNSVSVVLAAALLGGHLQRQVGRADLVSWFVPAVMAFNFSIVFFAFSGLTEGLSLLMFTAAYLAYRSAQYLAAALIVLAAAFQRELIPILLFGVVAADLLIGGRRPDSRGRVAVLACAALSLAVHVALRLGLPGDAYGHQVSPAAWIEALTDLSWLRPDFLFQVGLTQTLAFATIAAALLFRLGAGRGPRVARWLGIDCAVISALVLGIGIAASVGTNIGRLLIFWTPSLALVLASIARDWASVQGDRDRPPPGP